VEYSWQEGSLPPPHHYEYSISLTASGQSQITMIPDYPSPETPVWTETFTVQPAAFDELYRSMIAQGLLTTNWQALSQPPVGGSAESLKVTAGGRQIEIPVHVAPEQEAQTKAMYAALKLLVPTGLWEKLQAQRDEYGKAYQKKSALNGEGKGGEKLSIELVMRKYEPQLMQLPHVTGVGIGEKDGKEVIIVFVEKKLPETALSPEDVIPKMLDGYPTDVQAAIKVD
jgi:hypothetical protein